MTKYRIPKTIRNEIIPKINEAVSPHGSRECIMWTMDGDRGLGKSSASIQIHRTRTPKFDIHKQLSWELDEIREREFNELPPGAGHHIDELRFDTMDFRTKKGVEVKGVIKEIRPFQHFTTLTTPNAHDTMGIFLEYSDYYSYFTKKGLMILLEKNPKIFLGNKFGLSLKDLRRIKDAKTFNKYFIKPAKKANTYVGMFQFPQYTDTFTEEDYMVYNELRIERSRELANKTKETKRELQLKGVVDRAFVYCVLELRLTVTEVCKTFGISRRTYYNWCDRLNISRGGV